MRIVNDANVMMMSGTTVVTALVDNEVGRLVEALIEAGGVDTRHVCWRPFDGVGASARVGLNFTERGFGLRPARTVYDRANAAAASLRPGDVDGTRVCADGVRWLHAGGSSPPCPPPHPTCCSRRSVRPRPPVR